LNRSGANASDQRTLEIELIRAGVMIDNGEGAIALAILPPAQALASLPDADDGRRGEALCATGRTAEGLAILDGYLAAQGAWRSQASPFLARTRAIQGLCAFASGDAPKAAALALQARRAFQMQSTVSAYFKQPLERLEGALSMAPSAARARQ
jgi:hypothetical protein